MGRQRTIGKQLVMISLSLDISDLRMIDDCAVILGISRSGLFRKAAQEYCKNLEASPDFSTAIELAHNSTVNKNNVKDFINSERDITASEMMTIMSKED